MVSAEPSEDLLNKVRFMYRYFAEKEDEKSRYIRETVQELPQDRIGIRDESLLALEMLTGAIRISSKTMLKGLFKKECRTIYQLTEREIIRLEFVDMVRGSGATASIHLESVGKYEPGDWVQKLEPIYQKCLEIQNLREHIPLLERRLQTAENAGKIVKLVEETEEPKYIVNLLLLSDHYDANSALLFGAYLEVGRISEAVRIVQEAACLHPKDAQLRLMLGNLYWTALCNDKGWAPGLDPGALRQITLEVLNSNYALAAGSAEMLFKDAIRLASDQKTAKQAADQLRTLGMMDELYGPNGSRD